MCSVDLLQNKITSSKNKISMITLLQWFPLTNIENYDEINTNINQYEN